MAKQPIGSNLNIVLGDSGNFESDPSTWGFSSGSTLSTRSSTQKYEGAYSLRCQEFYGGVRQHNELFRTEFKIFDGKKYLITARVFVPSGSPFATGLHEVKLVPYTSVAPLSNTNPYRFVIQDQIIKTITQATDVWVEIQTAVLAEIYAPFQNPFGFDATVKLKQTGAGAGNNFGNDPDFNNNVNGLIYIDKLKVFEYIDIAAPVSDLAINKGGSVINDATGPLTTDGSIQVAITGGTGPFEYSNDNGASWQAGNYFAGLAPGNYQIKVRETDPDYEGFSVGDVFTVGVDGALFDFTITPTDETIIGANDGKFLITPSGPGAPFTFAARTITDPPVPVYQPSNLITGLSPNGYDVFVKDTYGNVLLKYASIVEGSQAIDKVFFHKNPITFEKAAAPGWEAILNYRLYDDVRVEDVNGNSTFNSKLKVDLYPETSGAVVFQVREAFPDVFRLTPPALGATAGIVTDRIKLFKHYTGELQEDEITPAALVGSIPNLVLWGGLSKFAFKTIDFFRSTNQQFMTWAPIEKLVDLYQEDYLSYFVFKPTGVSSIQVKLVATYDDATSESTVYAIANALNWFGSLWLIPAGPLNSGVKDINPAKNLVKYTVQMLDQNGDAISEERIFVIQRLSHPRKKFFLYFNSLGSPEVLEFTGSTDYQTQIKKDQIVRFLPYNYDVNEGELQSNQATLQRSTSHSTGYLLGKYAAQWLDYMDDFLLSPRVYDITDGNRRPIVVAGGNFDKGSDQDYERFVRFTAVDSFEDDSYTPKQ